MKLSFHNMRRMNCFLLVVVGAAGSLCVGGSSRFAPARQVYKWDNILVAYNAYIDYPSPDNAKSLLAALPTDRPDEISGNADRALKHIFSTDYYPVLYQEAVSGDRVAIEIFFRLLNVTDGMYSEFVLSTLGLTTRNQPRQFLELLTFYKDTKFISSWGYPVNFVGTGHDIHPKAAIFILEKRIESLETIKDPKYAEIKEVCLNRLRKSIIELK